MISMVGKVDGGRQEILLINCKACLMKGIIDPANEPDIALSLPVQSFQGEEWRTQKLVKELLAKYFTTKPDGIPRQ